MKLASKICGLTRADEAAAAAAAGATAIGLVFVPHSPRYVAAATAQSIIAALPSLMLVVGLAMNPSDEDWQNLRQLAQSLPINLWQFHGEESPEVLATWPTAFIKAIRVHTDAAGAIQFTPNPNHYAHLPMCRGFLLDSGAGEGKPLPWQALAQCIAERPAEDVLRRKPFLLAGGLTAERVGEAIQCLGAWLEGVDVSSGVEFARGRKSAEKIRDFIRAVSRSITEPAR